MPFLLVPKRFVQQPQYAATIDRQGLGKGAQILLNPAVGLIDQATGRAWTAGGDAKAITTKYGKAINFDGVDDYLEYSGYPELSGNVGTLAIWFTRVGVNDDFGHIYLAESTAAWFTQYHYPSGTLYFAGIGSTTPLSGWFNTTNRSMVLTTDGTAAGTKCYIDGADSGLAWSATPASWPAGTKLLHIGNYSGAATIDTDGSMLSFAYTNRAWRPAEAKAFHDSKGNALFKAAPRLLWVAPASGITLIGANSTQANPSSTAAITQAHTLTGAGSTQSNASSTGSIAQTHILTVAGSIQENASSTGSIAGGANLTIAPSDQANPSSTGAITQTHILVMAASVQDNIAAASPIVQAHILAAANAVQANLGSTGAIGLSTGDLTAENATQANLSGTGVISMVGIVPDAFLSSMAVSTAIKKPGVPAGTPDWLKTIIEIVLGRRGNKITAPAAQTLTFSATPTKAECEALYAYVNTVRDSVDQLLNRLDS
jgi:hypothetical protein